MFVDFNKTFKKKNQSEIKVPNVLVGYLSKKLPTPFDIDVGDGEHSRKLTINRVPNQSVHMTKYTSEENKPLYIEYLIDNRNNSISFFKISFNLLYAETIKDIVETTVIFNAFISGNGYIEKQRLNNICGPNADKYDEKIIVFWKKLLKLEGVLDIQFTPPKEDLDFEDMCLVEELYQNLVNKVPIRNNKKITDINGDWEVRREENLRFAIGMPLSLQFETTVKCTLFEKTIGLPCIIAVFNCKLSKYDRDGKKYKLHVENENLEKHSYTSTMYFKSKSELNDFKNKEFNDKIEMFKNAKKADEYLEDINLSS